MLNWIVRNRMVWAFNCVQTNDYHQTKIFEIELFDRLTVVEQMTDV